ncbi:hypothetical protein [Micromonospora fulviviridis]|uniref:Uncharacterized protein n=1 Tax=Micromonospora fulviviridis TaxID=47860 RepID=A0ABV2VEU2_9ACTN
MRTVKVQVPDATAAALDAAAAGAGVPTAVFAGSVLAKAVEEGALAGGSAPQPGSPAVGVPEVGLGGDGGPQVVARAPLMPMPDTGDPDTATVVSLALAFLRGDMVGAKVILESVPLPALLACALSWFNAEGIREHGVDGWDARLVAFLGEAARLRADG